MDRILSISRDPLTAPPEPRWRWKLWLALLPVLLILIVYAYLKYVQSVYVPVVTASAATFHGRFERGEDAIYHDADQAWQAAMTADAAHRFFNRIRQKLGPCTFSGPKGIFASTTTNGTFVTTTYKGQCSNGMLEETLTWRLNESRNGHAALVRYVPRGRFAFTD